MHKHWWVYGRTNSTPWRVVGKANSRERAKTIAGAHASGNSGREWALGWREWALGWRDDSASSSHGNLGDLLQYHIAPDEIPMI